MSKDVGNVIASLVNRTYDVDFLKRLHCDPSFKYYVLLKEKIYTQITTYCSMMFALDEFVSFNILCLNADASLVVFPTNECIINNKIVLSFFEDVNRCNALKKVMQELDLKFVYHNNIIKLSWEHWTLP